MYSQSLPTTSIRVVTQNVQGNDLALENHLVPGTGPELESSCTEACKPRSFTRLPGSESTAFSEYGRHPRLCVKKHLRSKQCLVECNAISKVDRTAIAWHNAACHDTESYSFDFIFSAGIALKNQGKKVT